MGKNTIFFVILMFFAGATGGVFSLLLSRSGAEDGDAVSATRPPERETAAPVATPVVTEADWLAMQTEVNSLSRKVEDLTGKLEAAHSKLESVAAAGDGPSSLARILEGGLQSGSPRWSAEGKDGVTVGGLRLAGLGKTAELMALPEEERWEKMRQELSLDSYQESELKRIAEDVKNATLTTFTEREDGGQDVNPMEFIGKMIETRKKATERVKNLLTDEQYEKYNQGGYGAAMGIGGGNVAISYSSFGAPRERRDK